MEEQKTAPSIDQTTLMAALAYVGPLVIVSYLISKDVPFVKFHIKQGLVLFVVEAALWFLGGMLWFFWPIIGIINLALFVLSIIGIVNVVQKKENPLPLVGSFSKYFNF